MFKKVFKVLTICILVLCVLASCSKSNSKKSESEYSILEITGYNEFTYLAELLKVGLERYTNTKVNIVSMSDANLGYEAIRNHEIDCFPTQIGAVGTGIYPTEWNNDYDSWIATIESKLTEHGFDNINIPSVVMHYAVFVSNNNHDFDKYENFSELAELDSFSIAFSTGFYKRDASYKTSGENFIKFYGFEDKAKVYEGTTKLYLANINNNKEPQLVLETSHAGYESTYGVREIKDDKLFFPLYESSFVFDKSTNDSVRLIMRIIAENLKSEDSTNIILGSELGGYSKICSEWWDSIDVSKYGIK